MKINESEGNISGSAGGTNAVDRLHDLAKFKIAEREKTRRLILIAVVVMWLVGAILPVVSPSEKTNLSIGISISLVVISLGLIGVRQFKLNITKGELETSEPLNNTQHPNDSNKDVIRSEQAMDAGFKED